MQTNMQSNEAAKQASVKAELGHVLQIIGPTFDVRFEAGHLPNILDAVVVKLGKEEIVGEVAQHLGNNVVRCIALSSTDGVVRGMEAVNTGKPITVPVGRETLGRMFNVLGKAIDEKPEVQTKNHYPIHRPAPSFSER